MLAVGSRYHAQSLGLVAEAHAGDDLDLIRGFRASGPGQNFEEYAQQQREPAEGLSGLQGIHDADADDLAITADEGKRVPIWTKLGGLYSAVLRLRMVLLFR